MNLGSAARGELAAKTTYQRAAKGTIAVSECPPDGKCVKIENTGRKVKYTRSTARLGLQLSDTMNLSS